MGCLCSRGSNVNDYVAENEKANEKEVKKYSVQMIAPLQGEEIIVGVGRLKNEGSVHSRSKTTLESNLSCIPPSTVEDDGKTRIIERPKTGHHRRSTLELGGVNGMQQRMSRIASTPHGTRGEHAAAGWPSWLASVAGEAIHGWLPRSAESYEKINKIGQGTYSSVYRARDLTTDKIVAMKKVRFVNMDPESVRFMAREISILRRLDHANVMKLEALVTSRISGSLYLVFEYMEHDLAGLLASPGVKFTEPQIKCYMQQMFRGLEHCHSRGVLHRDIKGSNLLVDNNGTLKIGDFGLATFLEPGQKQTLTSRVVTLWYRAPELLLGATDYGAGIDLWSAGCILAELFAGKPIMPGRTEVEQMHKIFKLCGSPTEEYWKKTKLPHASSFKSQKLYKCRLTDTFRDFPSSALALVEVLLSIDPRNRGTAASALKSEFFTSKPLPSDPSSLPKYPPSKELDAKNREEEARRQVPRSVTFSQEQVQKADSVKGGGAEYARNDSRKSKPIPEEQGKSNKSISYKYNPQDESGTGFPIEPPLRGNHLKNGYSHSNSVIHPSAAAGYTDHSVSVRSLSSSQRGVQLTRQGSQFQMTNDLSNHSKCTDSTSNDGSIRYASKRNRIHFSGPLMPPGGNMEDMLKEHEKQIQEAVRKAKTKKNCYDY
ncbi:putative serine/threonine-protein kinase-like [Dorcoceras hygrometricum]|uniref:Putative serine/threonine-protein kinase-like n=1 Tax=Dorcoceras hygrometricum TaxID=472368 RepID=A0A2Z7BSE2_9LAMI|nr:putative serine/threonine-protein kinase-like [Dorcoceras hygrometricum]